MDKTDKLVRLSDARRAILSADPRLSYIVDRLKQVDAVEVVHAEWACVNESENIWMCTGKNGCGNEILLLRCTPNENGWHFCPNRGAKMGGERRADEQT